MYQYQVDNENYRNNLD